MRVRVSEDDLERELVDEGQADALVGVMGRELVQDSVGGDVVLAFRADAEGLGEVFDVGRLPRSDGRSNRSVTNAF